MSNNNIPIITPGEIPEYVYNAWLVKSPIMLWGQPGIGKSDGVRQGAQYIAEHVGHSMGFLDRRLSQYESVDVRGIPRVVSPRVIYDDLQACLNILSKRGGAVRVPDVSESNEVINLMNSTTDIEELTHKIRGSMSAVAAEMGNGGAYSEWSRPDILPRVDKHGMHGLLFLDELPNATPDVQAPLYELILDRRLGDHRLPDGWMTVAAGNSIEDRSGCYEMSYALANRFTHFMVSFDLDAWINWAYKHDIDSNIIAYHNSNAGANLFKFDPSKDDRAFATPRSWERVSNVMKLISNYNIRQSFISGLVGTPIASEFTVFCNIGRDLPNVDEILDNWNTPNRYKFPPMTQSKSETVEEVTFDEKGNKIVSKREIRIEGMSLCYMILSGIAARTSEKRISVIWDIIDFLNTSQATGHKELAFTLCMDCMRKNKELVKNFENKKRIMEFTKINGKIMMS